MRILNVTAQKPDSTGSGVYLSELVRAEVALGHETAVLCGVAATDEVTSLPTRTALSCVRFETEGLPFSVCGMSDTMPYSSTRYRDLTEGQAECLEQAFRRAIRRVVGSFRPDLIVCHHLFLVTSLVREEVRSCPVVGICHSTGLRQLAHHALASRGPWGEALEGRIRRDVAALDAICALHQEQANQIQAAFDCEAGRVYVIGTGYNAHIFSPDASVERRAGAVVYAGKIWRKKGVASLIEACSHIAPHEPAAPLSLTLCGGRSNNEGEYEGIVRAAAVAPWPIELVGRLSQRDLARRYREAEVFVLPSFFEGLPLVTIEALACGCKVVMTDLPGIRPWVAENLVDAPIWWVKPPRMASVDEPVPEDLPAFAGRLKAALLTALAAPSAPCDTTALSWESVCERLLGIVGEGSSS
ncbi:MAG: glycosyltransferase family 4 protein [Olsenella profusa]